MEKKRIYMSHFTVQQKLNAMYFFRKEPNKTNISYFNSYNNIMNIAIIIPISQMRRLGQREFNDLVKVNTTNKW